MRTVVIGGGVAGLTAALRLARAGRAVTVVEAEEQLGGLARTFPVAGGHLDRYYHFVCRADHELVALLHELSLGDRLRWVNSRMGQFFGGVLHPFGEPWDLLRFTPFTPLERLRFGMAIMSVKASPRDGWRALADVPAPEWLRKRFGRRAYEVIYEPLIRPKFGRHAERLSAAWVWARFHRVGTSRTPLTQRERLGYLEGGMRTLVERLARAIAEAGGEIVTGVPALAVTTSGGAVRAVTTPGGALAADTVISTIPPAALLRLLDAPPDEGFRELRAVEHIGVVCVVLLLERSASPFFWTNISDPSIPLAGVIEFTRLNRQALPGGRHVVYLPCYLPADDARFTLPDAQVLAESLGWLAKVNPAFEARWVRESFVFRDRYAQPICEVGFTRSIPPLATAIRGLIVTDSSQLHPEDRTVSNSIGLGERAAALALGTRG